jgi:hypothetical protein
MPMQPKGQTPRTLSVGTHATEKTASGCTDTVVPCGRTLRRPIGAIVPIEGNTMDDTPLYNILFELWADGTITGDEFTAMTDLMHVDTSWMAQ